ncbi:MAG TPA: prepilin-type N-terminal cleavage/methylation domain-containing protein [Candidatus Saccharimonadales bacterium]|nr:prepilin-type N-terminal cleavage/methylation domain-containing protein [Candidatus Saccharimonadales bacterium]
MRMHKTNSKGFTLIELLIVIIIIGILAAISFVVYTGSQKKANQSAAEATVSTAKSKLTEYMANEGNYPPDQATFLTWVASPDGGNNNDFSTKFTTAKGFTYTAAQSDGTTSCSADASTCATYKIVGAKSTFKGTDDINQTN